MMAQHGLVKVFFRRRGQTTYFNGLFFLKGERHSAGNHLEFLSGDSYWISGIKKKGDDRHWAGGGRIKIDKDVVTEYLGMTNLPKLPNHIFEIVELNNNPTVVEFNAIENRKFHRKTASLPQKARV